MAKFVKAVLNMLDGRYGMVKRGREEEEQTEQRCEKNETVKLAVDDGAMKLEAMFRHKNLLCSRLIEDSVSESL